MILYHGSNVSVERIDLRCSKPNKDFGQGFYLSENEEQALQMARFKTSILGGQPVVSAFRLDERALSAPELKVKVFHGYSEDWVDFVVANREGGVTEHYDIVYGPIADDRVGLQIRRLKDGNIDKKELLHRLKYVKGITNQYYFGSEAAVAYLTKI